MIAPVPVHCFSITFSKHGPVVQCIVSLTTSLRRQLIRHCQKHCYFLLKKFENLLQLTFFQQKITTCICTFYVLNFNEMLTNAVFNLEQVTSGYLGLAIDYLLLCDLFLEGLPLPLSVWDMLRHLISSNIRK